MASIRILLVEDSRINAKIVHGFLAEGRSDVYEVVDARSLAEALDALEKAPFDVVLLDLMLPDSDDMATVDAVRAKVPDTAIVVLTASADTKTAKEALRHGSQDFLIKGAFDGDLLRHSIRYAVERTRMEVELREKEQRFQDYAEAGSDWFWEMGPDLTFTFLSDEFEAITGLDRADYLGKALAVIGSEQQSSTGWGTYLKDLQEHKPIRNFEYVASTDLSGGAQWFRINGRPLFDKEGTFLGYRGTGSDISIEKHAEMQVRRSKDLVDGILTSSLDGFLVLRAIRNVYEKVADFSFSHVNRRAEEILGRNRKDLLGRLFRLEMPHMVSQRILERAIQTVETGASFDVEQFYNEKGMLGWLRIIGVRLGDGVVITLSDISARKEAEREQRMATALFRTSAEGMMITDANNRIVSANPAFTRVTGYAVDEAIGKDPKFLASGRHPKTFYEDLWKSLDRDGHWFGEVWNRRKDGEVYVQRVTISTIRNEKGVIENYVAVFNDTTEEKEREEKLYQRANYDALTGLPNRALLEDRIAHALPKAQRENRELAVLFVDLDGFKPINDTHGHLAGDFMLQEVGKRFTTCVRESDTVSRLGGDEFVILCLDVESRDNAETVAKHLIASLEASFPYEGNDLTLGASIGVALYPGDGNSPMDLIEHADKAMYAAKEAGKGVYRFYGE